MFKKNSFYKCKFTIEQLIRYLYFPTYNAFFQKQQNSLIAGLRATNEILNLQESIEDTKNGTPEKENETEAKVSYFWFKHFKLLYNLLGNWNPKTKISNSA